MIITSSEFNESAYIIPRTPTVLETDTIYSEHHPPTVESRH